MIETPYIVPLYSQCIHILTKYIDITGDGILSMIEYSIYDIVPLYTRCIHILTKYIDITGDK